MAVLQAERLEGRLTPFVWSGYQWASTDISYSFMPDGTPTDYGAPSNLFATFDAIAPREVWQGEFVRALDTWATYAPLAFHLVPDDGTDVLAPGLPQGDPRFGDIRLGAWTADTIFLAYAHPPAPGNPLAGDIFLGSTAPYAIGDTIDLYSVLLHETGHSLGLDHSTDTTAVMYGAIQGVYTGLTPDDIAGIQSIYGARDVPPPPPPPPPEPPPEPPPPPTVASDLFESNDTEATAWGLGVVHHHLTLNGTFHTDGDHDWYRATAQHEDDYRFEIAGAGSVALVVRDAAGTVLASGTSASGRVVLTVSLSRGEVFTVEAYSPTGELFAYTLGIERVTGP